MAILPHFFSPHGPGAALGVERAGRPAQLECLGLADMEAGVGIAVDTVFDLASASKMFTAAYVREQLPAWASRARPGEAHSYSNTNYVALALVIEAARGCAYADFVESSLVAPFGLRDTFVARENNKTTPVARGYRNLGFGLPLFVPADEIELDTLGDGGVFSSLRDLLQWQALLWRGEIISHDSLALMRQPGRLDCGATFDYGLGFQVEVRDDERTSCGHGGSWTGSTVLVGRYPEAATSVVVLSNEFMAPVERISQAAYAPGA